VPAPTNTDLLSTIIFWVAVLLLVPEFASDIWNSDWMAKERARFQYNVPRARIHVDSNRPYDCDFLTAPIGKKHCSYERVFNIEWLGMSSDLPVHPVVYGTYQPTPPDHCATEPTAFAQQCYYAKLESDEQLTPGWKPHAVYLDWRRVED
jgi:hypothetical protein